jgi:hypothetical protein
MDGADGWVIDAPARGRRRFASTRNGLLCRDCKAVRRSRTQLARRRLGLEVSRLRDPLRPEYVVGAASASESSRQVTPTAAWATQSGSSADKSVSARRSKARRSDSRVRMYCSMSVVLSQSWSRRRRSTRVSPTSARRAASASAVDWLMPIRILARPAPAAGGRERGTAAATVGSRRPVEWSGRLAAGLGRADLIAGQAP